MSVKVRPYLDGGWEADVMVLLPNGQRHRERRRAPASSPSAAQRWGEARERELVRHGGRRRPVEGVAKYFRLATAGCFKPLS